VEEFTAVNAFMIKPVQRDREKDRETYMQVLNNALVAARAQNDRKEETNYLFLLGQAHSELGRIELAIQFYQNALTITQMIGDSHQEAECLRTLGNVYFFDLRQIETGIGYYEGILALTRKIGDKDSEAYMLEELGDIYFEQNELKKSFAHYVEWLWLTDKYAKEDYLLRAKRWRKVGDNNYLVGRIEDAIKLYEQAFLVLPGDFFLAKSEILRILGNAQFDLGMLDKAMACFHRAIDYNPGNALYYSNLADVFLALGEMEKAVSCYNRGISMHLDDAMTAYVYLGIIARRNGEDAEAEMCFEKGLSNPDMFGFDRSLKDIRGRIIYQENRALALLCLGRTDEAVKTLQTVLLWRQPCYKFRFTAYDLLAEAPNPPRGLTTMRSLLENVVNPKKIK
jgi:tetratricopeptide (TPR) repeat protein